LVTSQKGQILGEGMKRSKIFEIGITMLWKSSFKQCGIVLSNKAIGCHLKEHRIRDAMQVFVQR
jgi:hypothetical protein